MATLPTGAQLVAAATVSAMQGLVSDQATAIGEMPGGAVATTLTIAAGQVTPTVACHLVDTESAAASDDLTNIVTTNHTDGRRLLISMVDAARIVTVKHNAGGAGQIALANNYDLILKVGGWVELKRTGANWEEVGRSQNLISTVQLSGAMNESYATVASHATTADIWGAKGNVINFTGTAAVTAFPAAPQVGVRRRLICAGACSFTAGASLVIDGVNSGSTLTVSAGDVVDVESVTTTSFKLHYLSVNGNFPGAMNEVQGADIASASTINLTTATGNVVDVTGTTTITAITLVQGAERWVRFTGALTLTNGASLVLLGGANITTAAGDFACFRGYGSSVVRMTAWCPAGSLPGLLGKTGTWTAAQGGSITTDNDGSFDLSVTNDFFCTPTGSVTLTFTNHRAQKGDILFVNGSNYAVTAAATTKINSADLTTLSTTGTYRISYMDNGTNAYCVVSKELLS